MLSLRDFEGAWRLHRVIEGQPMAGSLTGSAEFWRDGADLIYREVGTLTLDSGGQFEARRDYRWSQEGPKIVVRFEDGRDFHDFLPEATAEGHHWCSPDTYAVTYDLSAWPVWTSRWQVQGPQKAYRMLSRYARAP